MIDKKEFRALCERVAQNMGNQLKEKEFAHWEYPTRKRPSIIQENNIWSVGILDLMLFLFGLDYLSLNFLIHFEVY